MKSIYRLLRRPSDSLAFAILYWTTFTLAGTARLSLCDYYHVDVNILNSKHHINLRSTSKVVGLSYFLSNRLRLVLMREYFIQSTEVYVSAENPMMPVPDIVFCTVNLTLDVANTDVSFLEYEHFFLLNDTRVPEGMRINVPCIESPYDSMWVFGTTNGTWNTYESVEMVQIGFLTHGYQNYSIGFSVFFVSHETNPYRTLNYVANDSLDMNPDDRGNYHFGNANQTDLHAFVVPQQLRVLRSDFWGYFNQYNDSATTYSLTSSLDYMYSPGQTWLGFYPPVMSIQNKQVLIMSLPDAISSWGGAFSITFGLFFILFGVRRLSPFGLIQKYLMCGSTKTNISRVYGNWKRDDDGYYYEDQGGGSGNREMTISSCPSPYGLDSVSTNDRGGFQSVCIDQGSGGSFLACGSTPSKGFPDVSEIHPQLLIDELLNLRKEMEAQTKALKNLQKQEQQFKDLETLLKEFYLDMDLVDTKEVDQDTMALLSLPTMDTRPPIGWTRRLIRAMSISQRHKAVDGHPESDTIGLSANAQEMAGQTQWDAPPPSFSRATGGDVGVSSDTIRLEQLTKKD